MYEKPRGPQFGVSPRGPQFSQRLPPPPPPLHSRLVRGATRRRCTKRPNSSSTTSQTLPVLPPPSSTWGSSRTQWTLLARPTPHALGKRSLLLFLLRFFPNYCVFSFFFFAPLYCSILTVIHSILWYFLCVKSDQSALLIFLRT